MIALVLGLLVIAGVSAIFLGGTRNYREDERVARMHDSTRFALAQLTHEIEMGGHWAEQFFPPLDAPTTFSGIAPTDGSDCGAEGVQWKYIAPPSDDVDWKFVTNPAIAIFDSEGANPDGSDAQAAFSCIDEDEIEPNTDIISIKRLDGVPTAPADFVNNKLYLRTDNSAGAIFQHPDTPPAIASPTDWGYRVTIYFIRNYYTTVGDGIPSLCRKLLEGVDIQTETGSCIPGIENLQVEAGLDTDADGVANTYVSAPDADDFDQIVGVRAVLLSRTVEPLGGGYTNAKTYALSNFGDFTPGDQFQRELTTATVLVRNSSSLGLYGVAAAAEPEEPPPPTP